jgi:hypothetical protein
MEGVSKGVNMKQFYNLIGVATVLGSASLVAESVTSLNSPVSPYIAFRSVGRDATRKVTGMAGHEHVLGNDDWSTNFFIQPGYKRSFRNNRLSKVLFGPALVQSPTSTTGTTSSTGSGCSSLSCDNETFVIAGTLATPATPTNALRAEDFYLPRDFQSTIHIDPRVSSAYVDFHWELGLNQWCQGLWFRVFGPFVHQRYSLEFSETITAPGTIGYAPGFLSPAAVPFTGLLQSFSSYAAGNAPTIAGMKAVDSLAYAKMVSTQNITINDTSTDTGTGTNATHSLKKNGFGELRFELGYDFWKEEDYHLGFAVQLAAPTNRRPRAEFLFEPVIGNGGMWELGGVVTGHYTLWRCEDSDRYVDFVLEADVTHLFKRQQTRTFDLKGKPLSRYMLAQKMIKNPGVLVSAATPDVIPGLQPVTSAPTMIYDSIVAPVANFSTVPVKVSVGVQGDVVAMFRLCCGGLEWDLGYNFWGRSCEKIDLDNDECPFPAKIWALKGDATVFGFVPDVTVNGASVVPGGLTAGQAIALSASENSATIFAGTNATSTVNQGTNLSPARNFGVDNPQFAFAGGTPTALGNSVVGLTLTPITSADSTVIANNQVKTSNPTVFIQESDLDLDGARTHGISNKVFTHLNYSWKCPCWSPYVGIGAEAEFGRTSDDGCVVQKNLASVAACSVGCRKIALTQWGVWAKLGFSFD